MPTVNITVPDVPTRTAPVLDDQTVADLRTLVTDTTVSRAAAEEALAHEGVDGVVRLVAARVADNLNAWVASGDWPDRHRTPAEVVAELADDGELDPDNPVHVALLRKVGDQ